MLHMEEHHHEGDGFWEEYLHIVTDPAHTAAELTFTLLDIIIISPLLFLGWRLVKRWIEKKMHHEHLRLDEEHGVEHSDNHGESPVDRTGTNHDPLEG